MSSKAKPAKSVRIPVKLPWKGVTTNEDQFVSMKSTTAAFLGLSTAKDNDLKYETVVRYKKVGTDGKKSTAWSRKKVKRVRRPGYKQRSVMIIFGNDNGKRQQKSIPGIGSVSSLSFPITKSVSITEVRDSFKGGEYKGKGVIRVIDMSTGQGYPTL